MIFYFEDGRSQKASFENIKKRNLKFLILFFNSKLCYLPPLTFSCKVPFFNGGMGPSFQGTKEELRVTKVLDGTFYIEELQKCHLCS